MKKLFVLAALIAALLVPSLSNAFTPVAGVSGQIQTSGMMTTAPNSEERLNLVPIIKYKAVFFQGDYNFDFNNNREFTSYQQKSLAGLNVGYGFSARYQYDNFHSEKIINKTVTTTVKTGTLTTKTVSTVPSTKVVEWNENRYGGGYNHKFAPVLGTTVTFDAMVLKEERNDFRAEENIIIDHKYFKIRNQVYHDFTDMDMTKYFDKITVSYKVTPNFYVSAQSQFTSGADRIDRLGITIVY